MSDAPALSEQTEPVRPLGAAGADGVRVTADRRRRAQPAAQVRRPPRKKGRELLITAVIAVTWFAVVKWIISGQQLTGVQTGDALPGLIGVGMICAAMAEWIGRRHMMLWPASALGILGPLAFGIAASIATPELRATPPLGRLPVIYGVCSIGMLIFLVRFKLPGLVSPVALFGTVALFLALTGASPEALAKIEGLTPRGVLAALLDRQEIAIVFGTLSVGACGLGWYLDRYADFFGVEAARPLHIVGGGILALILGRAASFAASPLDLLLVSALFGLLLVWSLRIDRMAVMTAGTVAMTRPLVLAIIEPLGIRLSIFEWGGIYTAMVGGAMVVWLLSRRRSAALGWTVKPRNIRWEWSDPAFGWREYKRRMNDRADAERDRLGT